MSIRGEIERISFNVSSAYNAVLEKGGSIPEQANSDNLAMAIQAIPSGGGGTVTDLYSINLSASNHESGEVSGGGMASKGMDIKVRATPNLSDNWMFTGWSEDGEVVSQANPYQFTVDKDRNLVANFDNLYKFGEDWFVSNLYNSALQYIKPSPLKTFLYNPHTETFFVSLNSGIHEANVVSGKFSTIDTIFSMSSSNFTIDDDGNLWWVYNSILYKYDIKTKKRITVCTSSKMPETSTYTWTWAAYGNGVYVIIDGSSLNYAYSYDAQEWVVSKIQTSAAYVPTIFKIINGYFVVCAESNRYVYLSNDGITWERVDVQAPRNDICYAYDNNILVVGATNCAIVSLDSKKLEKTIPSIGTASDPLLACVYADGMFVLVRSGTAGTNPKFYYGTDFDNLQLTDPITNASFATKPTVMRAAYGNGMIVVLTQGYSTLIYTSPTGPVLTA